MKSRYLSLASCLFLTTALACVGMALRPPEVGVSIPVRCANGKIGYIDSGGKIVINSDWDTATPFGPDDHAVVSVRQKSTKIGMFFRRWIPALRRFTMAGTGSYRIDRLGNTTPHAPSIFPPEEEAPCLPTPME